MMRTILFTLVLAATSAFAQGGATLTGRVVQDGRPEANALVRLESRTEPKALYTSVADGSGHFQFDNVPPGTYLVSSEGASDSARAIGVSALTTVHLRPGVTEVVELTLAPPPIQETVSVSAGDDQPIEQVSKTVNTISAKEMRERADFALVESLRSVPGLRVQQLGGFGRAASIKTRGLRTQDTAVLLDGIRLRDPTAITGDASPFLADITLTSVSEVEVLRGSGSSIYGTNAIGGVVDLKTPQARTGAHGQISAALGGLGLSRFRANLSNADGAGKIGISSAISHTQYSKGIDGDDDARNTNLQLRLDSQPRVSVPTFSGRIFFTDARVRLNVNPDTRGVLPPDNSGWVQAIPLVNFLPDRNDPDDRQRSRLFSGQLSANHYLRSDLVFDGYYQALVSRRRNDTGPEGPGFQGSSEGVFAGSIHTANATISWRPRGPHRVKAGYEFEHERFRNQGSTPDGTGNFATTASQSSNTVFFQDLIGLRNGALQIAGGARIQFFNLDRPEFSAGSAPYLGVKVAKPPSSYTFDGAVSYYFEATGTKLRAHVGNGYRVPSLYERFGTFFSSFNRPEFVAFGDPALKPERSVALDGGIEQYAAGERIKFTATYFYTRLIDTIGFGNEVEDIGSTSRPFGGYLNQNGGIARGFEISGTLRPAASTDLFSSYTYTNSDQRVPQVAGSGITDALGISDHQFTLVATQRFGRFWVNADLLVASDHFAPIFSNTTFITYVYRFEGNRRLDLTAGFNIPIRHEKYNVRLFATLENALGQQYFENGFRTAGRNGRIGLNFGF